MDGATGGERAAEEEGHGNQNLRSINCALSRFTNISKLFDKLLSASSDLQVSHCTLKMLIHIE